MSLPGSADVLVGPSEDVLGLLRVLRASAVKPRGALKKHDSVFPARHSTGTSRITRPGSFITT